MPNWSKPDTLVRAGEDLYSILESGKAKPDMPFGLTSRFDFRRQDINLQKKFGKDLTFDVDINKRSPMLPGKHRDIIRLGLTKKF